MRTDLWDEAAEAAMGHIELARWANRILVAPASADFLARLAHGLASDLLTTLCLATDVPIIVAPAMNRLMWANAATRANMASLAARGIGVIGPAEGDQACGETGPGRMVEPDVLAAAVMDAPATSGALAGRKVIVTAGPTRERIDPYVITNRSPERWDSRRGTARDAARVILISGPVSVCTPVESAASTGRRQTRCSPRHENLAAPDSSSPGRRLRLPAVQVSTEKSKDSDRSACTQSHAGHPPTWPHVPIDRSSAVFAAET